MDQQLTPEQVEWLKYLAAAALLIPALFGLRFLVYLLLPKVVIKYFFGNKQGYKNNNVLRKEKPFYEEED
jgi:hypothetical protein